MTFRLWRCFISLLASPDELLNVLSESGTFLADAPLVCTSGQTSMNQVFHLSHQLLLDIVLWDSLTLCGITHYPYQVTALFHSIH